MVYWKHYASIWCHNNDNSKWQMDSSYIIWKYTQETNQENIPFRLLLSQLTLHKHAESRIHTRNEKPSSILAMLF